MAVNVVEAQLENAGDAGRLKARLEVESGKFYDHDSHRLTALTAPSV